jgi:hypothetical protein
VERLLLGVVGKEHGAVVIGQRGEGLAEPLVGRDPRVVESVLVGLAGLIAPDLLERKILEAQIGGLGAAAGPCASS